MKRKKATAHASMLRSLCTLRDAMMHFLDAEKITKNEDYIKIQEVTADDITDLDSVEEDGQMMLRETRPLWRTPTKTAAFAVLDEFKNIAKSKVVIASKMK